jgi:uncharacterized membrane-anchored protein YhcB (DUF1043 family)
MNGATSTVIEIAKPTVVSPEYVALLEKVENIHGVGLALANVLVAVLALVLTVVGIAAAYLMWRNSREQKEERERTQRQYQKEFEDAQNNYNQKLDELLDFIQKQAEERIKELGADSADAVDKINKLNDELREIKKATISAVTLDDDMFGYRSAFRSVGGNKARVCDECGKYFAPEPLDIHKTNFFGTKKTLCKECAAKNNLI